MAATIGFLVGRGTAPDAPERAAAPPPVASVTPPPAPTAAPPSGTPGTSVVEGDGSLAIGITEENPVFLTGDQPDPWNTWREAMYGIDPAYYRLPILWDTVVTDDGTFDPAALNGGCMRAIHPCAGYAGLRDQFAGIKAAQDRSGGRFQLLVTFFETPELYARAPSGCERAGTLPRARAPRTDALPAYKDLLRNVMAEARRAGLDIRYWSPWNEPNHPYFISPQRVRCDKDAPSASVPAYVELARAMQEVLDEEPGEQEMVLAETGGLTRHNTVSTELGEFVRELPDDLVCAGRIFTQHGYVGMKDPVDKVTKALATHGCDRAPEIWITETGAKTTKFTAGEACRGVDERLRQWYRDPRVTAAFQYTLRDDDQFPTGLVSTDLTTPFPALGMWQAWGQRPEVSTAPPPRDGICG